MWAECAKRSARHVASRANGSLGSVQARIEAPRGGQRQYRVAIRCAARTGSRNSGTATYFASGRRPLRRPRIPALHSDTRRPFDQPKSGRIGVRVVNHLGDEVMKAFRVG